jgi:SAM-dependent methyltransferase
LIGRPYHRNQARIIAEYDGQWRKKGFDRYRPADLKGAGGPWTWGDFRFSLSNEAGAAVRLLYLEQAIGALRPRTVLEVGCGNGLNLHLLACRFPHIEFTGVEAAPQGCLAGQRVAHAGVLPQDLRDFAPFAIEDDRAVAGVRIIQGSGAALPFPDRRFDVVMTSLALEQMEEIRERALAEVVRVSAEHVLMLEPFREVNARGLRRAYVCAYDYFQGRIADLPRYGLEVASIVTDMPHKAWLGTALVTARRRL